MTAAICLYARDEARHISEWIAYHQHIGFDHVYIYDNNSNDGTARIARLHDGDVPVTVIPWNFVDSQAQYRAYDHCSAVCQGRHDWLACFDADEFLVLQPGHTLRSLLAGRDGCDAIAVHWAFFGSSGHDDYPSELSIEAYTHRSGESFGPSRHVKSIIRPGVSGKATTPHTFATSRYQLADRRPVDWQHLGITATTADYGICQLNHYFVRSKSDWRHKIRRGYRDGARSADDFALYDINEVEDLAAAHLAPHVRERMVGATRTPSRPDRSYLLATLLDPVYYLLRYDDIAHANLPAMHHFWTSGLHERRDPNPFFSSEWYAQTYLGSSGPDTIPFLHFLSHGASHGFLPCRDGPAFPGLS